MYYNALFSKNIYTKGILRALERAIK